MFFPYIAGHVNTSSQYEYVLVCVCARANLFVCVQIYIAYILFIREKDFFFLKFWYYMYVEEMITDSDTCIKLYFTKKSIFIYRLFYSFYLLFLQQKKKEKEFKRVLCYYDIGWQTSKRPGGLVACGWYWSSGLLKYFQFLHPCMYIKLWNPVWVKSVTNKFIYIFIY